MATDFMTALRSRTREQERGARLSGRPQTEVEAAAPYVAMAETAAERNAKAKALEIQEQTIAAQSGQFGQALEFNRQKQAENLRLEQERLAAQKEQEAARLAETQRQTNLQVAAAEKAMGAQKTQGMVTAGAAGAVIGGYAGSAAGGLFGGAAAGAEAGSAGGPYGAAIGAVVGAIVGIFAGKNGCIIISACTDPHSYEVELSRVFRDKYMGPETLIGYYRLAARIAPLIDRFRVIRWMTRTMLVKRLVDYGEWILGMKERTVKPMSKIVTKTFLGLCQRLGKEVL